MGEVIDPEEVAKKIGRAGLQICVTFLGVSALAWLNYIAWDSQGESLCALAFRSIIPASLLIGVITSAGWMPKVGPVLPDGAANSTGPGLRSVLLALNGAAAGAFVTWESDGAVGLQSIGIVAILISSIAILVSWNILKIKALARARIQQNTHAGALEEQQKALESEIGKRWFARNEFYDLVAGYFLIFGFVTLIFVVLENQS